MQCSSTIQKQQKVKSSSSLNSSLMRISMICGSRRSTYNDWSDHSVRLQVCIAGCQKQLKQMKFRTCCSSSSSSSKTRHCMVSKVMSSSHADHSVKLQAYSAGLLKVLQDSRTLHKHKTSSGSRVHSSSCMKVEGSSASS